MAEEEVVVAVVSGAASSPAPTDHKRKLEDLEPEAPEQAEPDGAQGADVGDYVANDESEAKRPRVEDQEDDLVTENGYQREKEDEVVKENVEELTVENAQSQEAPHPTEESQEAPHPTEEAPEAVNDEQPSTDNEQKEDTQELSIENPQLENPQQSTGQEFEKPTEEIPQQEVEDVPSAEVQQQPTSETQTMSRKMEVPNNKVGVLIGKAGDTIRFLQYNSGAKIQITRDADADPYSASRPVELIGTLDNINKAEKLIKDVIAEADAGGSPSLVARGFAAAQAVGAAEQVQIQVPNEKVGLIIGKGGETIKSLQTRSGARIQLIPQHLPEGDQSKERTVRVTGDKKQIEMAREMIKEVMNQPVRSSTYPGSYNPQGYRPRGPTGPSQWGPRGPHPGQTAGYDYQRGPYPSQNQQYAPPSYGGYPPQQMAPRSSFGSGWEQRPPANMQGPPQSGGYDFYGGQGGHGPDGPAAAPHSASMSIHAPGPSPSPGMGPPPSQGNYNYGQPQGPDYGQQAQYSQTGPPQQGYGHGYDEPKYEGQAPTHPPYGHGSQPVYPQGGAQSGYPPQQPYGKPQSYGMPSQAPAAQSYGPPRATQPGDVPYQGPMSSNQSYGPNVPPQQYPYASSGPMQQTYPAYGSQPAADGYNQPPPASGPGYPQQGAQPMSGYSQPGGQQAQGYAQVGPQGGYGPYPSQPGYAEQQTQNNAAYGYQGPADPTYNSGPASAYGAQPSGQPGYVQPTPTQPSYDQSIPAQSGGYGAVPVTAPVGYGKSLSPQPGYPQYDATQMYGAHR